MSRWRVRGYGQGRRRGLYNVTVRAKLKAVHEERVLSCCGRASMQCACGRDGVVRMDEGSRRLEREELVGAGCNEGSRRAKRASRSWDEAAAKSVLRTAFAG